MGILSAVGKVFKVVTGPLGVLEDWAKEPLKRWGNKREQENQDKAVERELRMKTGEEQIKSQMRQEEARQQAELEKTKSELRMKEEEQKANLQIRMQTEINRINQETEQLAKDKDFERMKNVAEAVVRYRERLTELQLNTIRAIGEMDIELRAKAQDLILSKTREYKQIQDQAQHDAEDEFTRIIEKFSGNERVLDIMITNAEKKLASVIDSTSQFLLGLNEDIQKMNNNIDMITRSGQAFIDRQIESQFNSLSLPNSAKAAIEDAEVIS